MELKTNDVIYLVETLEDLFDLAERLDKLGCEWLSGKKTTDRGFFEYIFYRYKKVCIYVEKKELTYSELNFPYLEKDEFKNYTFITYKRNDKQYEKGVKDGDTNIR